MRRKIVHKRVQVDWIESNRIQQLAGIQERFLYSTLRNTCASVYAEIAGLDVATFILGHASRGRD
jgi:hypothetical protein